MGVQARCRTEVDIRSTVATHVFGATLPAREIFQSGGLMKMNSFIELNEKF